MVFKLQQILDEKNNIHSLPFTMAAETNPHVDPATLLQSDIIKELDELILMLGESRTQHGSVGHVYFRMEQVIFILMRADVINLMDQEVLDLAINSWENLKNIINNEELPKAVNFFYTGNVGRPSYDIPKEWLRCCLEYGFTQKDVACISKVCEKSVSRRKKQFEFRNYCPRYADITDDELNETVREVLSQFPNSNKNNERSSSISKHQSYLGASQKCSLDS